MAKQSNKKTATEPSIADQVAAKLNSSTQSITDKADQVIKEANAKLVKKVATKPKPKPKAKPKAKAKPAAKKTVKSATKPVEKTTTKAPTTSQRMSSAISDLVKVNSNLRGLIKQVTSAEGTTVELVKLAKNAALVDVLEVTPTQITQLADDMQSKVNVLRTALNL